MGHHSLPVLHELAMRPECTDRSFSLVPGRRMFENLFSYVLPLSLYVGRFSYRVKSLIVCRSYSQSLRTKLLSLRLPIFLSPAGLPPTTTRWHALGVRATCACVSCQIITLYRRGVRVFLHLLWGLGLILDDEHLRDGGSIYK
jgi:hypothetical protein